MNTRLEMLFEKYHFSDKDRYEINQFFSLLPDHKKQNMLDNFDALALKLFKIEEEINTERRILIGDSLDNIRKTIELVKKERLEKEIKGEIDHLKNMV